MNKLLAVVGLAAIAITSTSAFAGHPPKEPMQGTFSKGHPPREPVGKGHPPREPVDKVQRSNG